MKRTSLFLLLLLALCSALRAQVLNDSTVQVVAYWDKDEAFEFEYTDKRYKVVKGDTIWGKTVVERFELAVVDSTENSYTVKYTTLDRSSDSDDLFSQEVEKEINELTKDIPVYLLTDQNGSFVDFANWDELQETLTKMIDLVKVELIPQLEKIYPDSLKHQVEPALENMLSQFKSKEVLLGSMKYIWQLFFYHGAKLEVGELYQSEEKAKSPYDGSPIDFKQGFELIGINDDRSVAYFEYEGVYDSDQLVQGFINMQNKMLPSTMDISQKPEIPFMYTHDYMASSIDVNWGWTVYSYYKVVAEVGETENVREWTVELQ